MHADMNCDIDVVSWVACDGMEYFPGLIVGSKFEDGMLIFCQVGDIIVFAGNYFLGIKQFETLGFG